MIRGADGKLYTVNGDLVSSDAPEMIAQTDHEATENAFAQTWFASTWFASADFSAENA